MHLALMIVLFIGNGILVLSFLAAIVFGLAQGPAGLSALVMLAIALLNLFACVRFARLGSEEARLASELRKSKMRQELAEITSGRRQEARGLVPPADPAA